MLKVRLFGSGQAQFFDRDLGGFPGQQGCFILCYLLLNREHPFHRERLASIFWGDSSTQISRKNLRNNLWRVRQTLQSAGAPPDDYLLIGEESIAFISTSEYWLDIEAFEKISNEVQSIDGADLNVDQVNNLESAADLYTGDLLESSYDDWCLYDRERLRLMYLDNLNKLVAYHSATRNFSQGITFANRILALDHTYERVHRQLMWMHWSLGNRNAALSQYRQCCEILRDDLGIAPMEETRLLYEGIKTGHSPRAVKQNSARLSAAEVAMRNSGLAPLAEEALEKLKKLQETVEETQAELDRIERLLHDALSGLDAS